MSLYRIADVVVDISLKFDEKAHWYEPYRIDENVEPDFSISANERDIEYFVSEGVDITPGIAENMCLCTDFNRRLIRYGGGYLHSSAVKYQDKVFLFSASSGVGKSTLTERICRLTDGEAVVINDDKPSYRLTDGKCMIYGTPFAGGTDKQLNLSGELGAVIFIERSDINEFSLLETPNALALLLNQTDFVKEPKLRERLLGFYSQIITKYPFYLLRCTNTDDAGLAAIKIISENLLSGGEVL